MNEWLLMQDGRVSHLEHIFVRGSRVRFVIIPDMLKNAPMFKRIDPKNKVRSAAIHGIVNGKLNNV
jgi:small nuclear ribonucleoprotein D3